MWYRRLAHLQPFRQLFSTVNSGSERILFRNCQKSCSQRLHSAPSTRSLSSRLLLWTSLLAATQCCSLFGGSEHLSLAREWVALARRIRTQANLSLLPPQRRRRKARLHRPRRARISLLRRRVTLLPILSCSHSYLSSLIFYLFV